MALALPILLMIMALMVNVGTVASWKARALSVARNEVFSTRWPRTGTNDPRPAYWPQSAQRGVQGPDKVPELDDPSVDQVVARGPQLANGTQVNRDLLDPTRGLRQGTASMTRGYPMLGRMGQYRVHAETTLLDDKWQYQRMGLGSNNQRRIPVIYALAKAPASLSSQYTQAVVAIYRSPLQTQLAPLDNDDEFIGYGMRFGWGNRAPDFHPRVQQFCDLDRELADERVGQLVERIEGADIRDSSGRVRHVPSVAERMAQAFIGLYRRVIRALDGQSPGEAAMLQRKIDTLQEFVDSLSSGNGG
jgi:hypothetical protein